VRWEFKEWYVPLRCERISRTNELFLKSKESIAGFVCRKLGSGLSK